MNFKKLGVITGKVSNAAAEPTSKVSVTFSNPSGIVEVPTEDGTSAMSNVDSTVEALNKAFYSGLNHSNDFRYAIASTLIGCIGYKNSMGMLACIFSIFTFEINAIFKIVGAFDKSKDKLDSSDSQVSYFGAISSIVDYECVAVLFGSGSCYGNALDKSFEYIVSSQGVQSGLEHSAEIKYAMIFPFLMTVFIYPIVIKTQDELKTRVNFYIMNVAFLTETLENFVTDKDQSRHLNKYIGAIPSIIDHQCDYIFNKSTGCYGTVVDSLYESIIQILCIKEEILKESTKEGLQHKSDYKYVLMGLIPMVGVTCVKGQIMIPSLIASAIFGAGLIELIDMQSEYSLPLIGVFGPEQLNSLKNLVENIHKIIGTMPCMLDHMCGAILFGNGSCYGDVLNKSYEYASEKYESTKNLSDNFSNLSNDYHEL